MLLLTLSSPTYKNRKKNFTLNKTLVFVFFNEENTIFFLKVKVKEVLVTYKNSFKTESHFIFLAIKMNYLHKVFACLSGSVPLIKWKCRYKRSTDLPFIIVKNRSFYIPQFIGAISLSRIFHENSLLLYFHILRGTNHSRFLFVPLGT